MIDIVYLIIFITDCQFASQLYILKQIGGYVRVTTASQNTNISASQMPLSQICTL